MADVDTLTLQKRLKVKFGRPELLAQALMHRSYLNESGGQAADSNERLEFLGDAVLGCIIARRLFERYPELDEGRLTELRASLVKGETLAAVAERLDLGGFLLLGRGEDTTGGRKRPLNLARTFEAVVGAIYLDRGFRIAEHFVVRALDAELEQLGTGEVPTDTKSRLQHQAQRLFGTPPRYRIISAIGPDHAKVFTVEAMVGDRAYGSGTGPSKRIAEKQAAEVALAQLASEYGGDS